MSDTDTSSHPAPAPAPTTPVDLADVLAAYGHDLHRGLGDTHHVVSPLGAWLVVALAAPAARDTEVRADLARVLRCDVDEAAALARALLDDGGDGDLRLAVGAWVAEAARRTADPAAYDVWERALPAATSTGPVPDQGTLDAWAHDRTDGMVPRFPVTVDPATALVLASAVLTRIEWTVPFATAPAATLGGPWAERVEEALRSPGSHRVEAVELEGRRYAAHRAASDGGTEVLSLLAEDADAEAADVIAAAHRVARGEGRVVPVADLPDGSGPVWTVVEREWLSPEEPHDTSEALLPAWQSETRVDLVEAPAGMDEARRALEGLLPVLVGGDAAAVQQCVARCTRTGFEAAAVTALMMRASAAPVPRGTVRHATARFARPFAVVATVASPAGRVPAFSGWVAEPAEAAVGD